MASGLAFETTNNDANSGQIIPAFKVDVVDRFGNPVPVDTSTVTTSLNSDTPGVQLASGTLGESAVDGVATFSDLVISGTGAFSLSASDGFSTPHPSNLFAVTTTAPDTTPPTSSLSSLPEFESTDTFTVAWSGSDGADGSGVASYSVYVSDNGGLFAPFLTNTTETSATFTGQSSHTYGFYSVATDNAGNVQATPTSAQASTTIDTTPPTASISQEPPALTNSTSAAFTLSGSDDLTPANQLDFDVSLDGSAFAAATSPVSYSDLAAGSHTLQRRSHRPGWQRRRRDVLRLDH